VSTQRDQVRVCNRCKILKEISEFGKWSYAKDGLMKYCKKCASERVAEYTNKNPEKVKESRKKSGKKYYENNKDEIKKTSAERHRSKMLNPEHRAKISSVAKRKRDSLKLEMISSLGGRCSCCGISEPRFLSIEHIGGGGCEHRRQCGGTSYGVLLDAKKQGWPKNKFDVLCFNCNLARAKLGYCPHEKKS